MKCIHIWIVISPGITEVVFSPGAEGAGEALAVDVDLLVPFSPPCRSGIEDIQEEADKPAFRSGNTQGGPVHRALGLPGLQAVLISPAGVEVEEVFSSRGRTGKNLALDCDGLFRLVRQANLDRLVVGHVPSCDHRAIFADPVHRRLERIDAWT